MIPFNKKKHSDITVTVSDGAEKEPKEETFHLHKFPLVSKSHFFDENIPDSAERPGAIEMHIKDFPGGPAAFEIVAKWCYGIDIELTVDEIAPVYCGARYLHAPDLEKTTDAFMTEIVLPDPRKAAKVLRVATDIGEQWHRKACLCPRWLGCGAWPRLGCCFSPAVKHTARGAFSFASRPHACPALGRRLAALLAVPPSCQPARLAPLLPCPRPAENMREDMMENLVGRCINAIAASFGDYEELNALPPDCFACIVRNARDLEESKDLLERAVTSFLKAHLSEDTLHLTEGEFIEVVSATGRMDDMRHCDAVYSFLEVLLRQLPEEEAVVDVCKALHDLGFWVSLPHSVIERAYADRAIPDRYCTVALMAENRHLLKVNEQLAEQVEHLSATLSQMGAVSESHRAVASMGMAGAGGHAAGAGASSGSMM